MLSHGSSTRKKKKQQINAAINKPRLQKGLISLFFEQKKNNTKVNKNFTNVSR